MDLSAVLAILAIIYGILLFSLPFFAYSMNNNIKRIIVILEQMASEKRREREVVASNIKICARCGATNRWMDSLCVKCGEPV